MPYTYTGLNQLIPVNGTETTHLTSFGCRDVGGLNQLIPVNGTETIAGFNKT